MKFSELEVKQEIVSSLEEMNYLEELATSKTLKI